jgi:hypothetical protein
MATEHSSATDQTGAVLIDMAVEGWRFSRLVRALLTNWMQEKLVRYVNQLRYFQKKSKRALKPVG